jgi:hypothetical protein
MKFFFIIILLSANVLAAPAAPGIKTFTQSNGQIFSAELKGDEYFSWMVDSMDRVIQYNPSSSNYEYTIITTIDGDLALGFSGVAAADNTPSFSSPYSNEEIGIINRLKLFIIAQNFREKGIQEAPE